MDERREYFRITNMAFVLAAKWEANQESIPEYFPKLRSLLMQYEILKIEKEAKELYFKIEDEVLKEILQLQNKKLDLMSQHLAAYDLEEIEVKPQLITIGEGGASFISDENYKVGNDIALALVFTPSYLPIFAKAKVVGIDNEKSGINTIHCEFYPFSNKMRQALMQHLLKQQTLTRQSEKTEL